VLAALTIHQYLTQGEIMELLISPTMNNPASAQKAYNAVFDTAANMECALTPRITNIKPIRVGTRNSHTADRFLFDAEIAGLRLKGLVFNPNTGKISVPKSISDVVEIQGFVMVKIDKEFQSAL
jgi:hypothetical protein